MKKKLKIEILRNYVEEGLRKNTDIYCRLEKLEKIVKKLTKSKKWNVK